MFRCHASSDQPRAHLLANCRKFFELSFACQHDRSANPISCSSSLPWYSPAGFLPLRYLKLSSHEWLHSVVSAQPQSEPSSPALHMDLKIKEWAAFALSRHPIGQLRHGNCRRPELKIISILHLHDLHPAGDQLLGQFLVTRPLRRIERSNIAIEFPVFCLLACPRPCRLVFLSHSSIGSCPPLFIRRTKPGPQLAQFPPAPTLKRCPNSADYLHGIRAPTLRQKRE